MQAGLTKIARLLRFNFDSREKMYYYYTFLIIIIAIIFLYMMLQIKALAT
jgi:hypothetical protein